METIGHQAGQASNLLPPDERGFHGAKRRRPSGQAPPLPRELGAAGKFWIGAILVLIILIVVVIAFNTVEGAFDRQESRFLRWLAVRRWRHLVVLVLTLLVVAWLRNKLAFYFIRPRPFGARIIGGWEGSSFPSRPVAELAAALVGIAFTLLPRGMWRNWGKVAIPVLVLSLGAAEIYLGLNHPVDVLYGMALGGGITLIALRWLTPIS